MAARSDQWRGSLEAEHLGRVFDQLLEPRQGRVLLLAMLVVGDQEREHVASDPVDTTGSMLVTASGQTPEVIATDPGVMWIFSGSRFHSP